MLRSLRSPPQARDLVAIATGHALKFASGKSWAYSNTNYVLLGLIVETATGNPVGHELEQRILWPLHLWATSFDTDDRFSDRSSGRRSARFAHGYSTIAGRTFDAKDLNPSWATPPTPPLQPPTTSPLSTAPF